MIIGHKGKYVAEHPVVALLSFANCEIAHCGADPAYDSYN